MKIQLEKCLALVKIIGSFRAGNNSSELCVLCIEANFISRVTIFRYTYRMWKIIKERPIWLL